MSGGPAIGVQATGWRDIGPNEGAVATVRSDADLVMVPFRNNNHYIEGIGDGAGLLTANAYTSNPDGTGSGMNVTTTTQGTSHGVRVWVPFNGRCFGVRWLSASTVKDFTVAVDGEAVGVEGWPAWLTNEGITTQLTNARAMALTHDNLDPMIPHVAQINFVGESSSVRSWVLFGFLLDKRFAFDRERSYVHYTPVGTLTAAAVAIPLSNGATDRTLRAVRKVLYYNTDASARIVTIKNGSTIIKTVYLAAAGTTGDSGEWDIGGDMPISSSITHQASVTSVVSYQVIGAY